LSQIREKILTSNSESIRDKYFKKQSAGKMKVPVSAAFLEVKISGIEKRIKEG